MMRSLASEGAQALIVLSSSLFIQEQRRIVSNALARKWVVVAADPGFAEAGALIAYFTDLTPAARRAAYYVDGILKGTKPVDLPIEQPMLFDLVVNVSAAKAFGLIAARDHGARNSDHSMKHAMLFKRISPSLPSELHEPSPEEQAAARETQRVIARISGRLPPDPNLQPMPFFS